MSKTDSSAAVTPEIGLEDDTDMLEGTESKQFSSLSATLHCMNLGQVGRAAMREGDAHEGGEPDTRKLEETEEDSQVFERIGGSDVGDASMETHDDEMSVDGQVDSDLDERCREELDQWMHDDDQRHSGEALVEKASEVGVKHGGSRMLHGHHRCC